MICNSIAMREVARRMERASRADCPVVIWGEPGTGKRSVAASIHWKGRRHDGPLIIVPASDVPAGEAGDRWLEEELFGTGQGGGRLEEAAGGTLVIDEITRLSLTSQARLLEAAETRHATSEHKDVGERLDFRLIVITRSNLAESVRRGVLRHDLHYRLGVVTIHVPPLRDRSDDIPELIRELLQEICAEAGRPLLGIEPSLPHFVQACAWPGNVAQLRRCLTELASNGEAAALTADHLRAVLAETDPLSAEMTGPEQIAPLAHLETRGGYPRFGRP